MASYQDIESRLRSVEDKIDFVMKVFTIKSVIPSLIEGVAPKVIEKTLLDAYYATKAAGFEVINASDGSDESEE